MNTTDRYLKFVQWNEADKLYVGYCPDLFPWGGVCHNENEEETYHQLAELVREEAITRTCHAPNAGGCVGLKGVVFVRLHERACHFQRRHA